MCTSPTTNSFSTLTQNILLITIIIFSFVKAVMKNGPSIVDTILHSIYFSFPASIEKHLKPLLSIYEQSKLRIIMIKFISISPHICLYIQDCLCPLQYFDCFIILYDKNGVYRKCSCPQILAVEDIIYFILNVHRKAKSHGSMFHGLKLLTIVDSVLKRIKRIWDTCVIHLLCSFIRIFFLTYVHIIYVSRSTGQLANDIMYTCHYQLMKKPSIIITRYSRKLLSELFRFC